MSEYVWRSVGIIDNQNMNVPHVLQQQYYVHDDVVQPTSEHRVVSIHDVE